MFLGILMCLLTGALWALTGMIASKVAKAGHDASSFSATTNFLSASFAWIFLVKWHVVQNGAVLRFPELAWTMIAAGLLGGLFQIMMMVAMRRGHNAIAWTVGQSAMVIPFMASILIWHDPLKIKSSLGVFLLISTIIFLGMRKKPEANNEGRMSWLPLVLTCFIVTGVSQTFATMPSRWADWTDTANLRFALSISAGFLFSLAVTIQSKKLPDKTMLVYAVLNTLFVVIAQYFLFKSMDLLSPVGYLGLVYPLAIGVCIIGFAFYSIFSLKEHFGKREITGLVCGLIGILLIAWPR